MRRSLLPPVVLATVGPINVWQADGCESESDRGSSFSIFWYQHFSRNFYGVAAFLVVVVLLVLENNATDNLTGTLVTVAG